MKKILLSAIMGMASYGTWAQEVCGTDHMFQRMVEENPAILEEREALDAQAANYLSEQYGATREGDTYIIPTVVHVLWYNCEGNISRAQVENGIEVLNRGFNLQLEDTASVRNVFREHMGAMKIEFRLARLDENGNTTDGINRRQTSMSVNAGENVKSLERWDIEKYFNIWVVENIDIGVAGQVNGYAQFPNSSSWNTWGVVIRNDKFGTVGTSNADGSTLTHEVGHCFNLYHTFQDGCGSSCSSTGDRVCDTPPAANPDWSCSTTTNTCSNDGGSGSPYAFGTPDMMENFMSYSSCRYVFTKGQVTRMTTWALDYYSVIEGLYSEQNLEATGVGGFQLADFTTENPVVVAHKPAQFLDQSLYNADGWSWEFGASSFPPASTDQHPEVTFIETGLLPVKLKAYYAGDSLSVNKDVFVVSERGLGVPFAESFEETIFLTNETWMSKDIDGDGTSWIVTSNTSFEGDKALMIENFGLCGNTTDELISSTLDLEPFTSAMLDFRVAYAKRNVENNDFLRLYISEDFGKTWDLSWVRGGNSLKSVEQDQGAPWLPVDSNEWKAFSVSLSNFYMKEGVMLKFEFSGDGGNHFYLDDIRIHGTYKDELFLMSPANSSQGLPEDVKIDWKAVGDVDFYEYQVDKQNTFDTEDFGSGTIDYISADRDGEDTEFLLEDLDRSQTYFWRVRYSKDGTYSAWSSTWSFKTSSSLLGSDELITSDAVKIFPVPASNQVTIEFDGGMALIQVIDISGRLIHSTIPSGSKDKAELDLGGMTPGAYFVRITSLEGKTLTGPLIIQ